jgi:enoyl-CoA hydratase/carnithine racemase
MLETAEVRFQAEHWFNSPPGPVVALLTDPQFYVALALPDLSQPFRLSGLERSGRSYRGCCGDWPSRPKPSTTLWAGVDNWLPRQPGRGYPRPTSSLSAADYRNLLVTADGPAARIALNRPERRNALSLELMEEMIAALREVSRHQPTRAVVIEGAGQVFSAGHDLSEMIGREPEFFDRLFDRCTVMMELIHELPQPVIAKVHGVATAAGCQLVAACDLAVAAEGTRFATPGVKIGLFCSTPMVPVSRAVGRKRAMQMLLTGEPIDATSALEWGLVNQVVPGDQLEDAIQQLIQAIARSSAYTVATGKRAFYSQIDRVEDEAYEHCQVVMSENALAPDAQEGMTAFLEKRDPVWLDEKEAHD